ncbi:MAG: sulfatase [bacterium]|nr:sulfatase [bacterium]
MLSRRRFLETSVAAPLISCSGRRRPNIIVIVTDDQRPDAMGCHEGESTLSFMETPNMDRLASEGVRFRNAFVTTSLCSPSRAPMLSGKYVHSHRVNRLRADLPADCPIFPAMLREGGYETGFVGKWHLGPDSDVPEPAFDYWAGVRGQGKYADPELNINGEQQAVSGYSEEVFADLAIDWVKRDRRQPFFLWMAHKAPHSPCTPPAHLETLFDDLTVPLPATYNEKHDDKPTWFVDCHDHDAFHQLLYPEENYQKYVKNYCRTLASVDENLGRMLEALDESGLAEDTAIFYLGDNGHFLGEHQLYSKMLAYEESIRIPLLARYPRGGPARQTHDELVLNVDLAPTILEVAGLAPPDDFEGHSAMALARGEEAPDWRQSFLYEYFTSGWGVPSLECVRTADGWKYVRFADWEQMYNLNADPIEVNNLAQATDHAERKNELMAELKQLGAGVRKLEGPSQYKRKTGQHQPH